MIPGKGIRVIGLVLVMALTALTTLVTFGASEQEILDAIDLGVEWLAGQQHEDGSWYDWEDNAVGTTGFAVAKLCDYAIEKGYDSPLDPDYLYAGQVEAGLEHILLHAVNSGPGICFRYSPSDDWHETYFTGVSMMALVSARSSDEVIAVGNPTVDGLTYKELLQFVVDYFAWAQNPDGGWLYREGMSPSDNSNTGYAVLGLRYAEAFGCTIPQSLKDNLSAYIDYIQGPDGGSGYTAPGDWTNVLKTGNLLFEMAFVGDTIAEPRVQAALAYIGAHWNDANSDPGFRIHYQAMYCLMKGFESLGIDTIDVSGSPVDWYQVFADLILDTQQATGSWPWDYWGGQVLATEWALLTLERIAPPPPVKIDIKPGSFPNSINPDQNGTTPVAILSNEGFDAPALVDLTTLTFGSTGDEESLSYNGKNKATPHCGFEDVDGDGLLDIVAHFVTDLCGFAEGDEVGYLKGTTFDGVEFVASDSVRIVPTRVGKKDALEPTAIAQELIIQVAPNPIRDVHTAYFSVLGPMAQEVDELWVQILDLSGGLVWEEQSKGTEVAWHTNSLSGEYMANGIYIYRVLVLVDGQWVIGRQGTFAVMR